MEHILPQNCEFQYFVHVFCASRWTECNRATDQKRSDNKPSCNNYLFNLLQLISVSKLSGEVNLPEEVPAASDSMYSIVFYNSPIYFLSEMFQNNKFCTRKGCPVSWTCHSHSATQGAVKQPMQALQGRWIGGVVDSKEEYNIKLSDYWSGSIDWTELLPYRTSLTSHRVSILLMLLTTKVTTEDILHSL